MILIGMFDSPFVRRVAVTMELLGLQFEHRNWSVGRDADKIRQYNPLGRVPTLVLDDGEVLIESAYILEYLDELAGSARAFLPAAGVERRRGLKLMATAAGGADKAVAHVYERMFRPQAKWHQPWLDRCQTQTAAALRELEKALAGTAAPGWLLGPNLSQADITVACCYSFVSEALGADAARYPKLAAHAARCEQLPAFKKYRAPFFAPTEQ